MSTNVFPQQQSARTEPVLSANAIAVLENRYLMRGEDGRVVETPSEMLHRVAKAVAAAESSWGADTEELARIERKFYSLMATREFFPNSPTLMNAGRGLGMLSACFVLPLDDSIEGIMETARQIALVQRAGGGTGIDFSSLRPRGSIVRSSGGTTDGPLSFLKMLSGVTDAIQQGAFRRGANMATMRVDHPDILAFIDLKLDLSQVVNYNLSVAVTDDFMESLNAEPNKVHVVVNPHTGQNGVLSRMEDSAQYDAASRNDEQRVYTVGEVWDHIVQRAWRSGDPGVVFIDEINRHNQTPVLGPIRTTNPCGEQPLLPYEACNLGSINLATFCDAQPATTASERVNWKELEQAVELAVRFLDNVVEVNKYPTPEIDEATRATRKIGLGVMGFADLLFKLQIAYDSEEALQLADQLGSFIRETGWTASERLAGTRGAFPTWKGSIWDTGYGGRPMRNAHVVTIAPAGTISIIAGCSSGIEPLFSLAFTRQVLGGRRLVEVNPVFQAALRDHFTTENERQRIIEYVANHGSIQGVTSLPDSIRTVFRTARDVAPEWHVRMQAAWQFHTDAAVSKTVNLPSDASPSDVEAAFLLAYEMKCKGITVYRDGARPNQPMALAKQAEKDGETPPATEYVRPLRLPEVIPSVRLRQPTPFGNMHLHISVDPRTGREREVFAQLGKGGDLANSDLEAICRLVSLLLRLDGDIRTVIDQLEGIGSSLSVPSKDGRIKSLGDGLAQALRKYVAVKERDGLDALLFGHVKSLDVAKSSGGVGGNGQQETLFRIKCPDCETAGTLAFEEGCLKCHACGYSIC